MAGAKFVDADLVNELLLLRAGYNANVHQLHLYKNNYTPVAGSVFGSFTEADFSGYASQAMSYSTATLIGDFAVMVDSATRTFTVGAGGVSNTVYGYFVMDVASGILVYAERFSASVNMTTVGDSLAITTQVTLSSLN